LVFCGAAIGEPARAPNEPRQCWAPLFQAFEDLGVATERVIYADDAVEDISSSGVWVSAHPEVIRKMGTKQVLFKTRSLGWGTETDVYDSPRDLAERFPSRLARTGQLVIKQARGTAGNGVWRVDLVDAAASLRAGPVSPRGDRHWANRP
jgi:hypothetical protein